MRKISLTLALYFLSVALFSQQGPLLQKFKYRINTYRAINYSINGGSNFNKSEFVSGTHTNSSSAAGIGAAYFTTKSTDRILLTTSGSLYSSFYGNKSKNSTDTNTSRNFLAAPSFSVLNKWFSKNMFTELGTDISSNFNFNKNAALNYPGPVKNNQASYSIAVNAGIGKGRPENITDMQNALWLHKEMKEANILSRPLSDEELNELGQAITKGNNTRVLDSRKRTQFILETVDGYFQQKGVISKTDINYFTRLNDILFFAVNNPRLSGTEKYIRLKPVISGGSWNVTQSNTVDRYKQRYNTKSVVLTSGINKYLPVNLVHQQNYGASVKLAYITKDITDRNFSAGSVTSETHSVSALKQAGLNLFFEQAMYPNTRTIISFNLQSQGGYQALEKVSNFYGGVDLSGVFYYFISYRARLNCNAGMSYQKNMYYNDVIYYNSIPDNLQLFANLGLEISL